MNDTLAAAPQPETTDGMGIPSSCGKPLCSRVEHHPLCKMHQPQPAAQEHVPDSTGLAVVDTLYHWRPIDSSTQRGAKLQLINRAAGVATLGTLASDPGHWTHWAPLPTFGDRP